MPLPVPATIVFDLDGTLIDTAPDLSATLNVVLAAAGIPPLDPGAVRPMIGRGARALIEEGFRAAGAPLEAAALEAHVARFLAHYRRTIAHASRPFPGLLDELARLGAAGHRLAVCTNKPEDLSRLLLRSLGLEDRFEAILGHDSVPRAKPHPDHLLAAIAAAGGRPAGAVMIGDSATDVAAARGAGVPVILVGFGYSEVPAAELAADALISHYRDLPSALATVFARRGGSH